MTATKGAPAAGAAAGDSKPKTPEEAAAEKKERQERMAKAKADRELAKANKPMTMLEQI
jgi:hypothetical protein